MRSIYFASALLLATSPTALAAGTDKLGDALSKFPQSVLTSSEPMQAYFVDMTLLQVLGKEAGSEQGFAQDRLDFAMIEALKPLMMGGVETWKQNSGIDLGQVHYFAGMGVPPQTVSVWGLDSEATATSVLSGLSAGEFEPVGADGVIGNGEPMKVNIQARDIGNPWRDEMGRATFLSQTGNAIVQAATPDAVAGFLKNDETVRDHPVVSTLLGSLDAVSDTGGVVQAILISPTFGLQNGDPRSLTLSGTVNMDELRSQLASVMEQVGKGIPPYFGGIIADLQTDQPELVIALAYPGCDIAEAAAETVDQRWTDTMADSGPATLQTSTFEGADGLCAAVVSVAANSDHATITNPHAKAVFAKIMRRQFDVLQIGAAQE
ncbi:hypothetical protein QWE_00050 [Agrobacterium albertimagni AOL15]|uniref:Uncharacterized protein n=1 Tax=Agrobacterium albertimagni AOL15 TaxID=1156935 RepID=K2PKQ3_9HYPH|nr:hypothetical protein [Agrobacterium albertimagni]EKF61548.1 hypothetical protein QWE_00050 [Agrobacterium albertimagni AOL15]